MKTTTKTFYFKTGVNTNLYPNSPSNIPFDCEIPNGYAENVTFKYACDNPNLEVGNSVICCEIKNSKLLSKFAYFQIYGKTVQCQKVLELMDNDFSYQDALNEVLLTFPEISKEILEKELNLYI